MKRLHRWGRPIQCGALRVARPCADGASSVRYLAGELQTCTNCGLKRKQTHGGRNATYSRDHGATWGPIGGSCPPCDRSLIGRRGM